MDFSAAIIGAGPIGVELALALHKLKRFSIIHIFEKAQSVGGHIDAWKFVRLFSPWRMNVSELGTSTVESTFGCSFQKDEIPTGDDYLRDYLKPLAEFLKQQTEIVFHFNTAVMGIAKCGYLKGDDVNGLCRKNDLFRIVDNDEQSFHANVVFDCSGLYSVNNRKCLGSGGLPAKGEKILYQNANVHYLIEDILGEKRSQYSGKNTVVIGSGYSAITMVQSLLNLKSEDSSTQITWITRKSRNAYERYENDPLKERDSLSKFGNTIMSGNHKSINHIGGYSGIRQFGSESMEKISFQLEHNDVWISCDNLCVAIGYLPNTKLYQELHVKNCWATDGLHSIAQLIHNSNCLTQSHPSRTSLLTTEPMFFVLGSKSYGRRSSFLLSIGLQQIEEISRYFSGNID
tara:strand:- start:2646 stop:3851 length:1206 start_codon:yes stop_codon:yes gene_type:complete